jgi:hypothetical protein
MRADDLSLDDFATVLDNLVDAVGAWRRIDAAAAGKAAELHTAEHSIRA